MSSIFPEPEQTAGHSALFEADTNKSGIQLQCEGNSGSRLWSEYRRDGFSNVSSVRDWCSNLLIQFNIAIDRFDDHCGWNRTGSYGRYTYNGQFLYFVDYPGNPQFFFEPYCDGGGPNGNY
jgi:hypothetical protein